MGTVVSTRSATRLRRLVTALIALALAVGGLGGIAVGPAAAQDVPENEAEQITQRDFDRLTRAAQEDVLFGPEEGALELEEEAVAFAPADVEVENFLVHVEFTNPFAAADGQWDYGIQFRSQSSSAFLRLILISDGTWGLTEGLDNVPATGFIDDINGAEGETNEIDLYVDGDIGHFGLNGDYVVTFELPVDGAGDITVGSGFLADSYQEGAETGYAEWIVWSLDEGGLGPDDDELSDDDLTATAEAEQDDDELSDDDLTATAEAEDDEELSDDDLTATAESEEDELSDDDLTATAEAEDEETETPETGDEPTYESPQFGYTLSYDDPWELTDEVSEDDGDLLELDSGASTLQIVGNPTRDTPEECVDALLADIEDAPDVTDSEIAQDTQDRDLRDDSDELSWVVVFLTIEGDDNEELELTGYYECRVIEEGESLLTVIHLALSDDYNDEIENRTAVLDTIEVDGGSSGGDDDLSDDDLTATAEAEEEESDDRTATAEAEEEESTPTEEAEEETPESEDETVTPEATSESLPEGSLFVLLESVGDAQLTAFGNLVPDGANQLEVQLIAFGGEGSFVTINEGTCADIGDVAFEVGQVEETGFLTVTIDASAEDIAAGEFVVLISTDGTPETAVACGVPEVLDE